jgi:hypothetical protein
MEVRPRRCCTAGRAGRGGWRPDGGCAPGASRRRLRARVRVQSDLGLAEQVLEIVSIILVTGVAAASLPVLRSLPAPYGVRGAFGLSCADHPANLATHSLQMKISVMTAKVLGSLTGYSAPYSVCTCWWDFLQNQHLNQAG